MINFNLEGIVLEKWELKKKNKLKNKNDKSVSDNSYPSYLRVLF
jgi:hypothetical protein